MKLCLYINEREWKNAILWDLKTMWEEDKQENPSLDFKTYATSYFESLLEMENVEGLIVSTGGRLIEIFTPEDFYREVSQSVEHKL